MIFRNFRLFYILILLWAIPHAALSQSVRPLYDGPIPFAIAGTDTPKITLFSPQTKTGKSIAVIVCSGGSYGGRANGVEGIPACKKLAEAGITAFLLDYRVPDSRKMEHKDAVPLLDAQRAIQYVRQHAQELHVDQKKVGMMGFSAGGHLVSTVSTHFKESDLINPDHIDLRPDFAILVYPVISFADSLTHVLSRKNLIGPDISAERIKAFSNELHVTADTPPTFLSHGIDDKAVRVENSLLYTAALQQQHVSVQLFLYEKGRHGYGVYNDKAKAQWIDDCIQWIRLQTLKKR